jgi:ribosomal protein L35AE/L33A
MIVLQIEHLVPDFAGWKKAFDSDPVDRKQSGVRAYRISRTTDNPNYVIIELEFDNLPEAEKMLGNLKKLWSQVEGKVMMNPQSRIIETIESIEYDR